MPRGVAAYRIRRSETPRAVSGEAPHGSARGHNRDLGLGWDVLHATM